MTGPVRVPSRSTRIIWVDFLFVLTLAAVLAVEYSLLVERHAVELRLPLQEQIVSGTAPSPYRYRVLAPWIGEVLTRLVPTGSLPLRHRVAYAVYDFFALLVTLGGLSLYFRRWMPRLWLAGLVLLAAFNRETAVFIPALYLAIRGGEGRAEWTWAGLYFAIWATVFLGLRSTLGAAPHVITLAESLRYDFTPKALALTALNLPLFLGPVPIFAALGYRGADRFLQRASWIVPLYVLTVYTFAYWLEVRLLMSMYALVIPLAWHWLMSFDRDEASPSRSIAA